MKKNTTVTADKRQKFKRWLLRITAVVIAVGLILVAGLHIVSSAIKSSVSDRILSAEQAAGLDYDCILVLGCGVSDDGKPHLLLRDRLDCGIGLYENGAGRRLLMSGDHGRKDYDEVNAMKDYAMEAGIEADMIFMDHAGFSTYESMYRARDVFEVKNVVIVTQRYHLYRALYIAEALGLNAYGVACDKGEYNGQIWLDAREMLARNKDLLYCIVKPLPTYLGPVIPISGSGELTEG